MALIVRGLAAALALFVGGAPSGERLQLARAWATSSPTGTFVRQMVYVKNTTDGDDIVAVVIGREPGLVELPIRVRPPKGWRSIPVEHESRAGERRWHLRISCESEQPEQCIRPGQTRAFDIVVRVESASIDVGPVTVLFSSGREASAAR